MNSTIGNIIGTLLLIGGLSHVPSIAQRVSGARDSVDRERGNANPGYTNGYNSGYNVGRRDAESQKSYNASQHTEYNQREIGYNPSYGSPADYQESYRVGFEDGYRDGYERLEKRSDQEGPTSLRYRPAFAAGYQEGYEHGRRDAKTNTHYNFAHDRSYQKADLGYNAQQFPSIEDYQYNFRNGYEAGYDDGYNNRPSSDQRGGQRSYTHRSRDEIRSSGHARRRENPDTRYVTGGAFEIPAGTTLRLKLNNTLSTRSSQPGDPFTAQVVEPVYVNDALAIPAGSTVQGVVTRSVRPGRVEGKAELNLRFDTLILPDDRSYQLHASLADVDASGRPRVGGEGTVTGPSSTGKDVGTVAIGSGIGALIGAIAGGGKGAAIGAGVGAGAGLGAVLVTHGKDLDLPQGTEMTIKLDRPLQVRR